MEVVTTSAFGGAAEEAAVEADTATREHNLQTFLPVFRAVAGVGLIGYGAYSAWRHQQGGSKRRVKRQPRRQGRAGQASPQTGTAVFCHNCGTQAVAGDKFCRECGTELRR